MNFADYITNAVRRVNRLWQLVLVEVLAVAVNLTLLVIVLGLPVLIAVLAFGFPLMEMIDSGAKSWEDLGAGHIGAIIWLIAVLGIFFLIYLLLAMVVQSFARAAMLGMLADDTTGVSSGLSFTSLIESGKRHFKRVLYYSLLTGAIVMAGMLVLALCVLLTAVVYDAIGEGTSGATVFAVTAGVTIAGLFVVLLLLWSLIYAQGVAPLMLRPAGAREALREAVNFLEKGKGALGFVFLGLLVVIAIQVGLALVGMAIQLIPLLGPLIYIPYSLLANLAGIYTGLCLAAAIMEYYYLNEIWPDQFAGIDEGEPIFEESSDPSDTYYQ